MTIPTQLTAKDDAELILKHGIYPSKVRKICERLLELEEQNIEREKEHAIWEKNSLVQIVKERDSLQSRLGELQEWLKKISALKVDTMLCDAADWDFDAESAYSGGANHAFIEAAEMADQALRESD